MMSDRSPINVMQPEWEADCYFRPGVTPQGSQGAPDPWQWVKTSPLLLLSHPSRFCHWCYQYSSQ